MGRQVSLPIAQKILTFGPRLTIAILGCCLFFIGLETTPDRSVHAAPQSSLSISMHDQQFSADIVRAPLEQVLHTLSSYGPIRFVIKGDVNNDLISTSFRHLSLEESLEKLLVKYDFAIIYRQIHPAQKSSEFPCLTEVMILSRNHPETLSDSNKKLVISPARNFSLPKWISPSANLEDSDSLRAFDSEIALNAPDFLAELDEVLPDTDTESLALIKQLLE